MSEGSPGRGGRREGAEARLNEGADAGLRRRLRGEGPPLVLDGATGTELERAGIPTGLPLWSTHALLEAPEAVQAIHLAYLEAGAELITANTFRTQRRTLARAGIGERDRALTEQAVELARAAIEAHAARSSGASEATEATDGRAARPAWLAGSLPPLEDCYRPDLVPEDRALDREHGRQAELLAGAGVDLILIETMNTGREAEAAARAAAATGRPFVVGVVSWSPGRLLSGEPLDAVADALLALGAAAVGVNCVPPSSLAASRRVLGGGGRPLLVSPNLGEPEDTRGFMRREDIDPPSFAAALEDWLAEPTLRVVGGCCGTTPEHVAALARRIANAFA